MRSWGYRLLYGVARWVIPVVGPCLWSFPTPETAQGGRVQQTGHGLAPAERLAFVLHDTFDVPFDDEPDCSLPQFRAGARNHERRGVSGRCAANPFRLTRLHVERLWDLA